MSTVSAASSDPSGVAESSSQPLSLKEKFALRFRDMKSRRTGTEVSNARQSLKKDERKKFEKDVRKKGRVKAMAERMGIKNDPELEQKISEWVRTKQVDTTDELRTKIDEFKKMRQMQKEATKLQDSGEQYELQNLMVDVDSSLISAHPDRFTLK